jgi:hypothetical protein
MPVAGIQRVLKRPGIQVQLSVAACGQIDRQLVYAGLVVFGGGTVIMHLIFIRLGIGIIRIYRKAYFYAMVQRFEFGRRGAVGMNGDIRMAAVLTDLIGVFGIMYAYFVRLFLLVCRVLRRFRRQRLMVILRNGFRFFRFVLRACAACPVLGRLFRMLRLSCSRGFEGCRFFGPYP